MTLKDRTVYHLSATGRLNSLSDPAGRVLDLDYDPDGYLSTVTDTASGRYLTFVWTDGTISQVATSPVSQAGATAPLVWKFYYEDEYLTRVCDARDNSSQGSCTVYDVTDGRVTAVVKPRGNTQVRIAYTAEGSVDWREDGTGDRTSYSYEDQRVTTTDPRGNTWVEEHDSRYRMVLKTDPGGNSTSYQYDDAGNRTQVVDSNGNVATMNYDSRGNLIALVDGEGHTKVVDSSGSDATVAFDQAYDYDYVGPVAGTWARVDPSLYRVDVYSVTDIPYLQGSYTPNADGTWSSGTQIARTGTKLARLVRVSDGAVVASTDPNEPVVAPNETVTYEVNGHTQYYSYDAADNMVARRDGRSSDATDNTYKTAFTYDAARNKLTETNPQGHTRSWEYTNGTESAIGGGTVPAGLVKKEIDPRGNEPGATPDDYATTYSYYATGDLAQVTTPAGLVTDFSYDELGRLTSETVTDPAAGTTATTDYTYDELSNTVTVTRPAAVNAVSGESHRLKITNTYDENSNLTRTLEQDIAGSNPSRTTIYEYDANDRQYRTTDPESGVLTREFDEVGNVVAVTDQEGRRAETAYDNRNLPVQVIQSAFDDGHASPLRDITLATTTYDDAGRKTTETDAEGRVTRWSYDQADRVILVERVSHVDADSTVRDVVLSATVYDDAGNPVTVTTGDGVANLRVVTNVYDAAGRLTTSTLDSGGVDRITTYSHDAAGNVTTTTLSDDVRIEERRQVFDTSGRMTQSTVENGTTDLVTGLTYDARGNQVSVTSPEGNTTTTLFDVLSRPVSVTAPEVAVDIYGQAPTQAQPQSEAGYDTFGNGTHTQDARGNVTVSMFDRLGRVTRIDHPSYTDPQSTVITPFETFVFDAVGNLVSRTSRRGETTDFVFDDLNRVATVTEPLVSGEAARGVSEVYYDDVGNTTGTVDPTGAQVEATFDSLNRVRTSTQVVRLSGGGENRNTTMFEYDDLGNRTLTRDPDGNDVTTVFNAASEALSVTDQAGETSTFSYDVAGRQIRTVDPDDRITESTFDLAGRMTESTRKAPDETVLTVSGFGHDANGNRVSATSPRGFTTTYTFDALNRLTDVTVPVDVSMTITTSYGYDESGNVTRVTDGNGNETWSTYQSWNLAESTIELATAAHPDATDRTWTTTYDAGGLPTSIAQPGGVTVTRSFDELARMTSELASGVGVQAASRTLAYDLAGRVISVDHPTGAITYSYDDRGLLTDAGGGAGAASFVYDALGRVTQRTDASGTNSFTWTPRSELDTSSGAVSGVAVDYSWTASGLPDTVTYGTAGTRTYGFDDLGRLTTDDWADSTATTVASYVYGYDDDSNVTSKTVTLPGNSLNGDHSYGYDQAGRLTSWTKPGLTVTGYTWDAAGNRIGAGPDVYTYSERNRLLTGPEGSYDYNPRGDLTTITGTGSASFSWDGLGRMVASDTGTPVAYTFDGLDRVATRNSTPFTYVGMWVDPTSDGSNTYGRSPGGRVVSHDDGTATSLVGLDRHGDVGWLATTGTGTITDSRVFDPFGQVAAQTGTSSITVGFQGDYTDPASGDVWMGARWYDPTSAQFRSRDTVFGELSTPISLNRYTYGWANPLMYWDPDGRMVTRGSRLEKYGTTSGARAAATTKSATRKRRADAFSARIRELNMERETASVGTASSELGTAVRETAKRSSGGFYADLARSLIDLGLSVIGDDADVLMFDPSGDGRIAVRIGPANADYTAIYVPGTGADLAGTRDYVDRARALQTAAADLGRGSVAVIYALPFDSPDVIADWRGPLSADCACNPYKARVGAPELAGFVEGLSLGGEVTMVSHSYGTTVTGNALANDGLADNVDRSVFLGSPGVGVDRVSGLNMAPGSVYAAQGGGDVINCAPSLSTIAMSAYFIGPVHAVGLGVADARFGNRLTHGRDPTAPGFGATYLPMGGFGHGGYFSDPGSLDAIARVVVGAGP